MRLLALLGVVLVLAACAGPGGQAAARSACDAYAAMPTTTAENDAFTATAEKDAALAASSDPTWAGLQRDITAAHARRDANAAAQRAGHPVSGADLDAFFAVDKRVRADCAAAGRDIGPLKP